MLEHNGKIVKGNGFLVDDLTDHGLDFIEKNNNEPFFLYMPFNTPHSPMQVPDAYWNRFADVELKHYSEEKETEERWKQEESSPQEESGPEKKGRRQEESASRCKSKGDCFRRGNHA